MLKPWQKNRRVLSRLPSSPSSESGFTLIESLLAIIIVSILLVGIAPVIALSVANRVQAKRVQGAIMAGQGYLERLRSGSIEPSASMLSIDKVNNPADDIDDVAAPNPGTLTCQAESYCTAPAPPTGSALYCVDGDSDGVCTNTSLNDFIIQAFGKILVDNSNIYANSTQGYRSYKVGIRVYRADAFSMAGQQFQKGKTQSAMTGGIGLSPRQAPLQETITEIMIEDAGQFRSFCTSAGNIGGC